MSENIQKTLTKAIVSEILKTDSTKSKGTKIATNSRVIQVIVIKPFSK